MLRPLTAYSCGKGAFCVEESYEILLANQPIGTAFVKREGLYYSFRCCCRLSGDVIYKLMVSCGDNKESLGVCVPRGNSFGLETRLPVKRLGEGSMAFFATPRHMELKGRFVPIRAEEPFAYIDRLQTACLEIRDSQVGIVLPEDELPTHGFHPAGADCHGSA